MWFSCIV
ncbi:hypothetical protein Zm00014a_031898 [Zea mays]|nr:hypothetical protein Zm00014a_031898 [Zea mays]